MARFAKSGTSELARRHKNTLCRVAEGSAKTIDIGTSYRVPPALDLGLYVSSAEEVVALIDERIHVYAAIARGSCHSDVHESASFEHDLYESLKIIRIDNQKPRADSFYVRDFRGILSRRLWKLFNVPFEAR